MGLLKEYIISRAEEKKQSPTEWLEKTLAEMNKCTPATHVGKFTNPYSKISIMDYNNDGLMGYISHAGTKCENEYDISINAAYLAVSNLLLLHIENGSSVLETICNDPEIINAEISQWQVDINDYIECAKSIFRPKTIDKTEDILKQVYFPVGEKDYHVLTILPNSCLLMEMGRRLGNMRKRRYDCLDKKHELYGENYNTIMNLTAISYGGTKPQNISTMNSKTGGTHYLLESLPPVWQKRVRLPKYNFFGEVIYYGIIKNELVMLDKLFKVEWNNFKIREGISKIVDDIVDKVMHSAAVLQNEPPGWSTDKSDLPMEQCVWLDQGFMEKQIKDDGWLYKVSEAFGRWMIQSYEKVNNRSNVLLGDDELKFFSGQLEKLLSEERRYAK